METFEEDRRKILNLAGLKYEEKRSNSHEGLIETNFSTVELTTTYFKDLPKDVTENLQIIYKYDFELFDYDQQLYL